MPYQSNLTATIADVMGRPGRAQADAMRRSGEAQARALEVSGQAWGNAAQNIGQIAQTTLGDVIKERQQAPIRAAQMRGLNDQHAMAAATLEDRERAQGDVAAMDTALQGGTDLASIEQSLTQQGRGHLVPTVRKAWQDADAAALKVKEERTKAQEAETEYFGSLARGVVPFLQDPDGGLGAANIALQHAEAQGHDVRQLRAQLQADPSKLGPIVNGLIAGSKTASQLTQADTTHAEAARHNLVTEEGTAATAKATTDRLAAQATETQRHNRAMEARPVAGARDPDDVVLTVQGMKEGTLPPQLPGRASKEYIALMAEAKRQGYDLAGAATDWMATQKHIATLNGAQQTRMAQAIDNASHSLDVIEDLAKQWQGGKFPALNKVQLAAAKQGLLGEPAQVIATKLDAQIADVTSELGNVYMGGNSPTDHALGLAAKNMSADWTLAQLLGALDLSRRNLTIRQNSMRNVGVAGASAGNQYAPPAAAPAERWIRDASGKLVRQP